MNLLRGQVVTQNGATAIVGEGGWRLPLAAGPAKRALASDGQVIVGVRHRNVLLSLQEKPDWMAGRVYTVEPTGDLTYVHVRLGDHLLVASADAAFRADPDSPLWLTFDQDNLHLFDANTEQLLREPGEPAPMRLTPRPEPAVV
jgi:multiple sugar transport system ATP-binding protein